MSSQTPDDEDDGTLLGTFAKIVVGFVALLVVRWLLIALVQLPFFLCPF